MVEGSSKEYSIIKKMMFDELKVMHQLLDKVAQSVTSYLNAQIAAGAQAVMIFDTWGGILTPHDYKLFSLTYMDRIVNGLQRENEGRKVPVILFTQSGAATSCRDDSRQLRQRQQPRIQPRPRHSSTRGT